MPRSHRPAFLTLLAIFSLVGSSRLAGQSLDPVGLPSWDSTNQVLFFGHGVLPGGLLRGYADGSPRGADINLLNAFPGVREVIVDGITAGHENSTIIAAILKFDGRRVQRSILTYDALGRLQSAWDAGSQNPAAIAYSKDDDALFVLGGREISSGVDLSQSPLLVEYDRTGHLKRSMLPADVFQDRANAFQRGSEIGEPSLKVSQDRIYIYAPTNREVVECDRNGHVLASRSVSDIVEKIAADEGYRLSQIHQVDFSDDGQVVMELLLGNDRGWAMEVVRIDIKTGKEVAVHKAVDGSGLSFIGLKDGKYIYLRNFQQIYVQPEQSLEPVPFMTAEKR